MGQHALRRSGIQREEGVMSKKRDRVRRAYPLAICVCWWSEDNAYHIHKDANSFQECDIGRGASPSLAWADAYKRLPQGQQREGEAGRH
jgi:hypothetical protein